MAVAAFILMRQMGGPGTGRYPPGNDDWLVFLAVVVLLLIGFFAILYAVS